MIPHLWNWSFLQPTYENPKSLIDFIFAIKWVVYSTLINKCTAFSMSE